MSNNKKPAEVQRGGLKGFGHDIHGATSFIGTGMGVIFPFLTYRDSRKEGHGVISSAARAIGSELMYNAPVLGQVLFAKDIIGGAYGVASELGRHNAHVTGGMYHARFGGHFQDSKPAYTLRQKGLAAMNNSNQNLKSVLGNEARMYHRSNLG